jgi:hypothetical protein
MPADRQDWAQFCNNSAACIRCCHAGVMSSAMASPIPRGQLKEQDITHQGVGVGEGGEERVDGSAQLLGRQAGPQVANGRAQIWVLLLHICQQWRAQQRVHQTWQRLQRLTPSKFCIHLQNPNPASINPPFPLLPPDNHRSCKKFAYDRIHECDI